MNRLSKFIYVTVLLILMCKLVNNETSLKDPPNVVFESSDQTDSLEISDLSKEAATDRKEDEQMKIQVQAGEMIIVYELNSSNAAKALYAQLPLTLEVENFSTNEKVFYPPQELPTEKTPTADAKKGTLAYYAPWGDVVMFYEGFGTGSGLYELGEVVFGKDNIEKLSGTIVITIAE